MSSPLKVHELLDGEELAELEKFAREPGRTIDECHQWLLERSFNLSRGAVHNWLRKFKAQVISERANGSGELAKAFMEAVRSGGGLQVQDAAIESVGQMFFERMMKGGDVETPELVQIALGLQRLSLSKVRVEAVRSEFQEREKAALDAASKVVQAGGNAGSVVDKVREILGIKEDAKK